MSWLNRDYVIAWMLCSNITLPNQHRCEVNASYRCLVTDKTERSKYFYKIFELKYLNENLYNPDTRVYTAWHVKITPENLNGVFMDYKSGVPTRDSKVAIGDSVGVASFIIVPNYNYTFNDNVYTIELKNQWGNTPYAITYDGSRDVLNTEERLLSMDFVHRAKVHYYIETGSKNPQDHESSQIVDSGISVGGGGHFSAYLYLNTSFEGTQISIYPPEASNWLSAEFVEDGFDRAYEQRKFSYVIQSFEESEPDR